MRRIEHGDYDLILTFFTPFHGKLSAIAKAAKKSKRRFSGVLELFSVLEIVYGRGRGLPVLQEATLKKGFPGLRGDLLRTAYASYWAQLIAEWAEEGQPIEFLYPLFLHCLERLDEGRRSPESISMLFQIRFLTLAGLAPNLARCSRCGAAVQELDSPRFFFDMTGGDIRCENCRVPAGQPVVLSKGTVLQMQWAQAGSLKRADRIRFSAQAVEEGGRLLEGFVPFHLGKEPRSLRFLRQIRGA